ncbi:MAG: serine/threonine protein kinase [Lentisphaerae bacterium]|nr:serine/threonine protein kinase [Lentisphaerota bacterium]
MAKEPRHLAPGTVINGYRIERELGRGAMAVVYLATQLDLERPVALKVLSTELAADAEFVARFFNEARAAASMSHPHIVQAYDAGIAEGGIYYFCMEFVDGETLLQRLNRQTRLDAQTCVAMALDIADALNFGWQRQKFTHGDIKPENIMINSHEQAKLADFGLAKVEGHDYDGTDIMLTPLYAPPELIRGERGKKDCRSDIYAFGATLYHALAGTPPYPGTNAQTVLQRHLKEPLEPLRQRYPKAPQWFSDLIGRMLEKDPAKRPQSWDEVIEGLKKVQSGLLSLRGEEGGSGGPVPKKTKLMRTSGGKAAITPQQRKAAKRTSQGVVTMFILAVALSVGTVFLKRHVEQQQSASVHGTVVGVPKTAETNGTTAPVEQGGAAVALAPETVAGGGIDVQQGAEGTPAIAPGVGGDDSAAEPAAAAGGTQGDESVTGPSAAQQTGDGGETSGMATPGAPGDVAAVPAATFSLRVPDVSIPIDMSESQQQAEALIDAAWCLNSMRYDFNSATPVEPMLKTVNEWLSAHPQPNDAKSLMLYLRDVALPALADGKAQLVVNKAKVLGRTLSGKRERQFVLHEITYDKIEVQELLAGGHVVRTLSWPEFYAEGLVDELFKETFFARENDPQRWRPYLAYLAFTNQPRALKALLASYPQNHEEARHWEMVLLLFEMAGGRKLEVLKGWQDLRQACRMGLSINAYRLASELRRSRNSVSMAFPDILDSLIQRCGATVPEVQAAALVQQARQQLRLDPAAALNLILLAKARYGAGNFPEKSKLEELQNEALAGLSLGMDKKLGLWDAVPFVAFSRSEKSLQRSYVANAFMSQTEELAGSLRAGLPGLRVLSLLEMGDWLQASKLAESKQVTALLEGQPLFRRPALFGRALLAMRYGTDPSAVDKAALALTQLPPGSEKFPAMYVFAPEYALLSRRADREFLYRFRTLQPGLELKGAPAVLRRLQHLDLCLCLEGAGRKDAMDVLTAIAEDGSGVSTGFNSEILRADAHRMHEMIRLGSGDFFPPMPDPKLFDSQLRSALACVGDRSLTGESDETFMHAVESEAMYWSLIGGDAVYEWLLRRCAADIETGDLEAAVARVRWALELPHACMYSYYGRLQLLLAGLHNLAGQSCGYLNAHATLPAATVASEVEKRLIRLVYERDGGRSLLSQLGYGHQAHFFVPWLELSYRLGRGERDVDLERRFGRLPLTMAERRLVAGLSVFQRERLALAVEEK